MKRILRATSISGLSTVLRAIFLCAFLSAGFAQDQPADIRQKLISLRERTDPHAVDFAWPYLNSPDPSLREAARVTIESQPFDSWKQRALDEKNTWASLEALRAVIEACPAAQAAEVSSHVCDEIALLRIDEMSEGQQLFALQLTRAVFVKLGPIAADERTRMLDLWSHFPGSRTDRARAEVTRLVAFLEKAPAR